MSARVDGEAAASGMVAFIVAGFVFVGSVAAVLYTSDNVDNPAIDDGQATASLQVEAGSIADLLLESAGLTATMGCDAGPCDWDSSSAAADHLVRLGLLDPANPGFVDFGKFQNLRLAPLAASTSDGKVNYNSAIQAMGLAASGLDFHVRSYPNLQSIRDILSCNPPAACRDPNLRVAYIGDIDITHTNSGQPTTAPPITLGAIACSASAVPNTYQLSITATIPQGTGPSQFEGVFDAKLENGAAVTRKVNSFLVPAAGGTVTFAANYAATDGRSCAPQGNFAPTATFSLYDSTSSRVARVEDQALSAGSATVASKGVTVDTDQEYYLPGQTVGITYDGEALAKDDPLFLTVCPGDLGDAPCGTPVATLAFTAAKGTGNEPRAITLAGATWANPAHPTLDAGTNYVVRLYLGSAASASVVRASERLLVTSTEPQAYVGYTTQPVVEGYAVGASVAPEVGFLEELVDKFCPTFHDSATASPMAALDWKVDGVDDAGGDTWDTRCAFKASEGQAQPGDVFPQARSTLKDELRERLLDLAADPHGGTPRYDVTNVLIVGSNVDHQMLTSNQVKETIATWVEQGGTLIVFGSEDQRLEWLQSVFHIATSDTSSNGISVPDTSHPILHTADDLDYTEYDHHGQTWSFKQNGANAAIEGYFTHVVTGDNGDPVLTISDPGAFGRGSVILTTWLAYDLFGTGSTPEREGLALINNMLMQGYRDLFLDYGPVIPASDHDVIPAVRKAQICHPRFDLDPSDGVCDMPIPLDVIVYVF